MYVYTVIISTYYSAWKRIMWLCTVQCKIKSFRYLCMFSKHYSRKGYYKKNQKIILRNNKNILSFIKKNLKFSLHFLAFQNIPKIFHFFSTKKTCIFLADMSVKNVIFYGVHLECAMIFCEKTKKKNSLTKEFFFVIWVFEIIIVSLSKKCFSNSYKI